MTKIRSTVLFLLSLLAITVACSGGEEPRFRPRASA